jgi:hypothetical protein
MIEKIYYFTVRNLLLTNAFVSCCVRCTGSNSRGAIESSTYFKELHQGIQQEGVIQVRRHVRGLLAGLAMVVFGLVATSAATAATVYAPTGERLAASGSGPGEMTQVGPIAVDEATGALLVARPFAGTVNVFSAAGSYLTTFGEGELSSIGSLAIDQVARAVYVLDWGSGRIVKYAISGTDPIVFTPDPTFVSPAAGPEPGEIGNFFSAVVAVDPTTGDLLVADSGNHRISRFTSSGAFVSSFDGIGAAAGPFHQISGLAVDPGGDIYVVDVLEGDLLFEGSKSVVERFAADGTADTSFAPDVETPRTLGIDPGTDNLIVIGRSDGGYEHVDGSGPYPIRLYVFHDDLLLQEEDFPESYKGVVAMGAAVDGGGSGRMYVSTNESFLGGFEVKGVRVYASVEAPDLLLDEPTGETSAGAHFTGTVDPLGKVTKYHFEYSREGGATASTAEVELGPLSGPQPVEVDLTDLIANSEYKVQLVAGYPETGTVVRSAPRFFQTLESAPAVVTGDAVDVEPGSATLLGTVNPFGKHTTYHFEYGTSAAYGQRSPLDHDDVAGLGRDPLRVHGYLDNLQAGTEYHYRLVAESEDGVSEGADRTFATDSAAAAPRFYEQVSPVDKGGSDLNGLRGFSASPNGESLMFEWKAAPAEGEAAPLFPRSWAQRSPDGWTATPLDPPQLAAPQTAANPLLTFVLGISEDGSRAVVSSRKSLASGAIEGGSNYYLRDNATGGLTTIVATPGTGLFQAGSGLGSQPIVDGTPDYSDVLIRATGEPALPDAPEGALYHWHDGTLELASVAPDGTPLGFINAGGTVSMNQRDMHYISADDSTIFFEGEAGTYVRFNGEETAFIGGRFGGADEDGRYAFVYGQEMTPDSEPGAYYLYRFDTESRELELLTPTGRSDREGNLQVAASGTTVFFNSTGAVTPDAVEGANHLYAWHEGEVKLIATTPLDTIAPLEYLASPNGRWFAFSSYSRLTDYDNRSRTACTSFINGDPKDPETGEGVACREIYRYDVEADELRCASCPRDGGSPNGNARMGPENVEGDFSFSRSMLDDGTVIFDTTEPLSARDSNSNRDVYTFDGGDTTLISAGRTATRSEFDAASADGSDIFFTTQDRLVGQDVDTIADVYDARIGGGIATQNPPAPRGECIRDDCKATPNAGPELPFGGSEAISGTDNLKPKPRKRCGKGRHTRKVKGKRRCVKNHPKRTSDNRRQGR